MNEICEALGHTPNENQRCTRCNTHVPNQKTFTDSIVRLYPNND